MLFSYACSLVQRLGLVSSPTLATDIGPPRRLLLPFSLVYAPLSSKRPYCTAFALSSGYSNLDPFQFQAADLFWAEPGLFPAGGGHLHSPSLRAATCVRRGSRTDILFFPVSFALRPLLPCSFRAGFFFAVDSLTMEEVN